MKEKVRYSRLILGAILVLSIGTTRLICDLAATAPISDCCEDQEIGNSQHHDDSAAFSQENGENSHSSPKAPENCCKNWVLFSIGENQRSGNYSKLTAPNGLPTAGSPASLSVHFTDATSVLRVPSQSKSRAPNPPLFLLTHSIRV